MDVGPFFEEGLARAVLSKPRKTSPYSRVTLKPVLIDDELRYQFEFVRGAQATHANLLPEEAEPALAGLVARDFRQALLQTPLHDYQVLDGIKVLRRPPTTKPVELAHDRRKRHLLPEGGPVAFLIELGVMNAGGKVHARRYDKFRQVNRFLELVDDVVPRLPRDRPVHVVDFGSGRSYLTFALHHLLVRLRGLDARILGLDLKEEVIARCDALARKLGLERLRFAVGDIALYDELETADMVVSLHACDTATDAALERAVRLGARVILSAPCCQHELLGQISDATLEPLLRHGILKERFASLVTDAARAALLEQAGYEVQVLEFVDLEHTAKNLLIRAVKTGRSGNGAVYDAFSERLGIEPQLERALRRKETA